METLKKGSSNQRLVIVLQNMMIAAGYDLKIDGVFGGHTEKAVKDYQKKNGLLVDGVVGVKTWNQLLSQFPEFLKKSAPKFLSRQHIIDMAAQLDLEAAVVMAVCEVESSGAGFVNDKPKILFEGHVFWDHLKKHGIDPNHHVAGNQDILYRKWTKQHYRGGLAEYDRLERAQKIHPEAALESASWGLFQIMGFHYDYLGYSSIHEFVDRMHKSEGEHLDAFRRFIQAEGLVRYLKEHNWDDFAYRYNGKGYKKNHYDVKLAQAHAKYSAESW